MLVCQTLKDLQMEVIVVFVTGHDVFVSGEKLALCQFAGNV